MGGYIGKKPTAVPLTSADIEDGVVSSADLGANSVDSSELVDGSVDLSHMSVNSIDSDQYVDGSIDTAHIADDQITLAKMASGTDGNIISYDASGNPVAIATGSDGQVLTSTGAGSPPAFESVSAGTALTGSTNNQVVTVTGANAITGETNFIYNGTIIGGGADGANADLGDGIHIKQSDSSASVHSNADQVVIERNDACGLSILSAVNNSGNIMFGDSGDNDIGSIIYMHNDDTMKFTVNADLHMQMTGNNYKGVLFGQQGAFNTTHEGAYFATNENYFICDSTALVLNRHVNDGMILEFRHANTMEGNVTTSGSTVQYNTFCGSHWGRLADNSQPTILRGTVIDTIDTMIDWYRVKYTVDEGLETEKIGYGEIALPDGKSVGDIIKYTDETSNEYDAEIELQLNEQLPMTKVSDTEDSKAVYGVFSAWDLEPDDGVNDMNVASLGAFVIRVHKDETVAIGDLLSSKGDGTAKVQADDIMRASTIAKVTSTNKSHIHADDSYCVPCTLHCG